MDPARFVFPDETGASTDMVRRYGWGPKGERLADATPHGHRRTTTFVAGLRSTGFVAPLVLDGPVTGEVSRDHVEQALAPALEPGGVVVMDKALLHRDGGAGGGPAAPGPRQATRTETGLATRIMRLSARTAMAASPCWAGKVRARSLGPMIAL
jgi:hypothetical protein